MNCLSVALSTRLNLARPQLVATADDMPSGGDDAAWFLWTFYSLVCVVGIFLAVMLGGLHVLLSRPPEPEHGDETGDLDTLGDSMERTKAE